MQVFCLFLLLLSGGGCYLVIVIYIYIFFIFSNSILFFFFPGLVLFCAFFLGEVVTTLQFFGYLLTLACFAWYNHIRMQKKAPPGLNFDLNFCFFFVFFF